MNQLLRNPEYRRELIFDIAVTIILSAVGFILSPWTGALCLAGCVSIILIHGVFMKKRCRRIAELSDEIDRVLHSSEPALISAQAEGELSILQSEIHKLTVRLQEQADQLLADKKRLASAIEDIFHQLRTPLTAMNLSAEMLRDPELPREKQLEISRDLSRSIQRIRWQVETLLKISKIDAGTALFRTDPVPVKELVKAASEDLLIPMDLKDQRFIVEVSDEHFTGDLRWTAEAVGNLLKNAVDHTPEGGKIRLAASETPLFTEITVSDNGPGFPKEEIPYLFDRFYRGRNAADDSIGIGLALARMIVSAENGTIIASNLPEGGACFSVKIYKSVV